ncbi:MAG: Coenzyme F420 hydrogenase/dehydrogenase, beta subunit C-terminal domain [Dehalococcoidales bacterium]|nr:Coenzyme F420 hydrogenase/dehydrogenase, beta subunit C-terminal domain [Dehalococcoidales bacterium]
MPELMEFCFNRKHEVKPDDLGVFSCSSMGFATDHMVRKAGASGGIATALLIYGLETGLIDCALVAGFSKEKPWQTEAKIAVTKKELIEASQSKYAPVAVNAMLNEAIKRGFRKIAIVGCPCHIHAIRKLEYQGLRPEIVDKIKLLLGLFCGAQFNFEGTRHVLVEKCGVTDLEDITKIQYRGRSNSGWDSRFVVELDKGERRELQKFDLVFGGLMFFKRDRCAMCIDWSAELADISLADYWGPSINPGDEASYSSILVRSNRGMEWYQEAQKAGYIQVRESSPEYLIKSSGFETKKHGNAFHLNWRSRHGWPTPDYHYIPDYSPHKW